MHVTYDCFNNKILSEAMRCAARNARRLRPWFRMSRAMPRAVPKALTIHLRFHYTIYGVKIKERRKISEKNHTRIPAPF